MNSIFENLPTNWHNEFENENSETVYYLFNIHNKWDYVGESGNWKSRFFQETLDAIKFSKINLYNKHHKYSELKKTSERYTSYCIKKMAHLSKRCIKRLSENNILWSYLLEEVTKKYTTKAGTTQQENGSLTRTTPPRFRRREDSESEASDSEAEDEAST